MDDRAVVIEKLPPGRLDDLIAAQNKIFADYIIPMKVTRQFFLDFLESVGGHLSSVLVALHDRKIVGYVNPVVDGTEAWIGGLGVVPDWRGRGVGKRLMLAAEEACSDEGVKEVSLEVIWGNDRAHKLYTDLDYVESRRFLSAEGRPAKIEGGGETPEPATLSEILPLHEISYTDSCWQRRKASAVIESARGSECYATDGGFVILKALPSIGLVPFLGVVPEKRRMGIGTMLAKFALSRLVQLGVFKVSLYNLNDDLPTRRMMEKFDFAITLEQVELRKKLS